MSQLIISKEVKKKLKELIRTTQEEIEVNVLLIRNELRKSKVDKNKVISYLIKIEEAIK